MSSVKYRWILLSWLIIGGLGVLEGLYGRTQYLADSISYLNVSRAVSHLDWKRIFDPMWAPGYPVLVAIIRSVFPRTAEGEWYAITMLNCLIFLGAYASWRCLIRRAIELYAPPLSELRNSGAAIWITGCSFLSFGLCFDKVSRVSPDLLVTTLFLMATAETLAIVNRPLRKHAVLLGLVLGIGCWVKAVFLPFACIFLFIVWWSSVRRRSPLRVPAAVAAVFLLVVIPYLAAISWSYGRFTFGVSGQLNYAFHVNRLPHFTNWQGGPSQFGKPIHPTRQIVKDLPVFEFATPFRSTYPPYNNLAYWYEGTKYFFNLRNQLRAIGYSTYFLARIMKAHLFCYGLALVFFTIAARREWRALALLVSKKLWPLFAIPLFALMLYMSVHIEDRYLGAIFLILSLFPLTPLLDDRLSSRRSLMILLAAVYTVGAVAELETGMGATLRNAIHRRDFHQDPQWQVAKALPSYGLHPGDPVAFVGSDVAGLRCSWAYVSQLRIVAEFGSLPWAVEPTLRPRFAHLPAEPADADFGQIFWGLEPAQRASVMHAFRESGAKAVVFLAAPIQGSRPGWQPVGKTGAWIFLFRDRRI